MELYKGLPLKTITAVNKDSVECIFGVTTETVEHLVANFLLDSLNEDMDIEEIEEFDNSYSYAVPQEVFEDEDEVILKYINENIDDWYQVE
jgi:hypothetical protein